VSCERARERSQQNQDRNRIDADRDHNYKRRTARNINPVRACVLRGTRGCSLLSKVPEPVGNSPSGLQIKSERTSLRLLPGCSDGVFQVAR